MILLHNVESSGWKSVFSLIFMCFLFINASGENVASRENV